MRILARKALKEFWLKHPQAETPMKAWFAEVEKSTWSSPQDIKNCYNSIDFLKNNRVIFNISGNKYRIIVVVNYSYKLVYIRFIGTHKEYDRIDAETI